MKDFRTNKTQEEYDAYVSGGGLEGGCHICKEGSIDEFSYWRTIKNRFPYDNIADLHEMLVPKRHITEFKLNESELLELSYLKQKYVADNYEAIIESTKNNRSIPEHFHLHLINFLDDQR